MIQMFINNEEVVSNRDFTISEEILATSSTILNNCYPKTWEDDKDYVSRFYYPKDYSLCRILKNNSLIFAGIVKNSGDISLNPFEPKYCSLQILDFKTLLSEGDTLDFVISDKTITEAIQMVIYAIADYGFVLGNILIAKPNEVIGAYSTLNKTPYDVFQYLADISQSKWFTRTIDENTTAIDFYDPTLLPRANNLEYNQAYWLENNINSITFSYGTYDYRNKQVILSEEVYADIDYTETIIADGYNKTFNTQNNIGIIKSISVDNLSKTFATNDDKEIGLEADFYYTPGSNQIDSNENNPTILAGSEILIVYTPLVKGRQIVYDNDEINRIATQTNRKGIISRYENRNDILNSTELNEIAQTYIRYKGSAEIILKVETKDNDLYNIGDIVYFEAPIQELAQDYFVKKKETHIMATGEEQNIFYTYELSSSFNSENAINYFDNQRAKSNGNISQGEYIPRNIDIVNTINIIFYETEFTQVATTGDNILDNILDSPFNN